MTTEHLWRRWARRRDTATRAALVAAYGPLVQKTAHLLGQCPATGGDRPGASHDDLVGAALAGLVRAVDRFDPARGVQFETYALALIRGAVRECLRAMRPEPRAVQAEMRAEAAARDSLAARLGRCPTAAEVAQVRGLDGDDHAARQGAARRASPVSFEDAIPTGQARAYYDDLLTFAETVRGEGAEADTEGAAFAALRGAAVAAAIDMLPARWAQAIRLRYDGSGTVRTFAEVGAALGVCEARAYQLHGQAVARLRQKLTAAGWE